MKALAYVSLLICIVGGVIFYYADTAKIVELGKICFEVGLLVTLLRSAVIYYDKTQRF